MLIQTTETAIRALIFLALRKEEGPVSPRRIGEALDESPTYLSKIARQLVKANILRAHRGALGGVTLSRPAGEISLLAIVEACQGMMLGDHCQGKTARGAYCSFHEAMVEAHEAVMAILGRWTLADLARRPLPTRTLRGAEMCHMEGLRAVLGLRQ